jgi:photosystem II stability/assembly factor-like uncharacterized protein
VIYRRDENSVDHQDRRRVADYVCVAVTERVDFCIAREIGAVKDRLHADGLLSRYKTCTAGAQGDSQFGWSLSNYAGDSNGKTDKCEERHHCAQKTCLCTRERNDGEENVRCSNRSYMGGVAYEL